jgi:hypothetical protein
MLRLTKSHSFFTKFYKAQFVAFGDAGRRLQVPHTIMK